MGTEFPPFVEHYELSPDEVVVIESLLSELLRDGADAGVEPLLVDIRRIALTRLPAPVVDTLERLRLLESATAVVVSGLPVRDAAIGGTPLHWSAPEAFTPREDLYLALLGSVLGELVAWESLQRGRVVHNVLPVPNEEHEQSGHGSLTELEWHTEDGFHPYRCDYLGLMALRNPGCVPTTVASIDDVHLEPDAVRVLAQPRFLIRPDNEHLRQLAQTAGPGPGQGAPEPWADPQPVPVLLGDLRTPYLRIDPAFMSPVPGDGEAAAALHELVAQLHAALTHVVIAPGAVCFIDNYRAVHGRRAFRPSFDGTDRWLKKVLVTRDLRKSRAARDAPNSRIMSFDVRPPSAPAVPDVRKALLDQWRSGRVSPATAHQTIRRAPRGGSSPLSLAQERLWFVEQLHPGSPVSNLVFCARAADRLDAALLAGAVDDLVERHHALRTVVRAPGGSPTQVVTGDAAPRVVVHDLTSSGGDEAAALAVVDRLAHAPFDVARGPLVRVALVRSTAGDLLVLVAHHIVSDGWSLGVALRDLDALYRARGGGRPAALEPLPVEFADVAVWQREPSREREWRADLDHWREVLRDAPPLDLPTDRPRPSLLPPDGDWVRMVLDEDLSEAVRALARREGVTTFMVFHAALLLVLGKLGGSLDVTVGTAVANRPHGETHGLVGNFVNLLVLRCRLDGNPTLRDVLARVRGTCLDAFAHQAAPIERVVEAVAPRRDASRNALFQALLVLQPPMPPLRLGGITLEPVERAVRAVQTDVELHLWDLERIEGRLAYSTSLFDRSTASRMVERLTGVLRTLVVDLDISLSDVSVLLPQERLQLATWSEGPSQVAAPGSVVARILRHAGVRPEAVAVRCGGEALTYRELDTASAAVARGLRAHGVRRGHRVGLYLDRSAGTVAAVLGVLRAGAAYVPLDPTYPPDRLRAMTESGGATLVVTSSDRWSTAMPWGLPTADLADLPTATAGVTEDPVPDVHPGEVAYVIHTSGSTGVPKGIEVTHGSLCNLVDAMALAPGISADDAVASVASLSFDASVAELFPVLCMGGTVVLVPREDAGDGQRLARALEKGRATVLQATATTWRLLEAVHALGSVGCRALCGGEPTPLDVAERLVQRGLPAWNMYGPTETTVWSTAGPMTAERPVSLGRPLANTRVHVVDDLLQPVPIGVVGELCIGGAGLARGYAGRPELTAAGFVPDPFAGDGSRMYRTGDLVRWRPDGTLEFLARKDDQIKLRGHRIELGDVEAAVGRLPGVTAAVVAVHAPAADAEQLVAYVRVEPRADEHAALMERWKAELRERLPAHMVPTTFVQVESFPTTATGKVDRSRLPAPAAAVRWSRPPETPVEREIAARVAASLGLAAVGVDDDFFDLGGHSVLAARLMSDLAEHFGLALSVQELFIVPTVRHLADYVERELRANEVIGDADQRMRRMVGELDDATVDALLTEMARRQARQPAMDRRPD